MSTNGKALIKPATRRAFQEYLVHMSFLREIRQLFDDAGIDESSEQLREIGSSERRTLIESYYATVNWCDHASVRKVLSVYEEILNQISDTLAQNTSFYDSAKAGHNSLKAWYNRLINHLKRDGVQWMDNTLRFDSDIPHSNLEELLALTSDDEVLQQHLHRINAALPDDPAQAIGSSKELVESVCRVILRDHGEEPTISNEKFSRLIRRAREALILLPEDVSGKDKVVNAAKSTLGGLGSIVEGLNTIRNEIGTGHGRDTAQKLPPRYAYLAVDAAFAFSRFMLETQKDRAK